MIFSQAGRNVSQISNLGIVALRTDGPPISDLRHANFQFCERSRGGCVVCHSCCEFLLNKIFASDSAALAGA